MHYARQGTSRRGARRPKCPCRWDFPRSHGRASAMNSTQQPTGPPLAAASSSRRDPTQLSFDHDSFTGGTFPMQVRSSLDHGRGLPSRVHSQNERNVYLRRVEIALTAFPTLSKYVSTRFKKQPGSVGARRPKAAILTRLVGRAIPQQPGRAWPWPAR